MPRNTVYGLSPEERAAVKEEMRDILIDLARERQTICYSDLCRMIESIHLHHRSPMLISLLTEICQEEEAHDRALLCALVVSKTTGIPGGGYFAGVASLGRDVSDMEASWHADVDKVFEYWSNH
jgi:hypothetical protein